MGISRIFKANKGNIRKFFGELAIFPQVKDTVVLEMQSPIMIIISLFRFFYSAFYCSDDK